MCLCSCFALSKLSPDRQRKRESVWESERKRDVFPLSLVSSLNKCTGMFHRASTSFQCGQGLQTIQISRATGKVGHRMDAEEGLPRAGRARAQANRKEKSNRSATVFFTSLFLSTSLCFVSDYQIMAFCWSQGFHPAQVCPLFHLSLPLFSPELEGDEPGLEFRTKLELASLWGTSSNRLTRMCSTTTHRGLSLPMF